MDTHDDAALRGTVIRLEEQFKDRWSSEGQDTGIAEISDRLSPSELKKYDIFKNYKDTFLEEISPDVTLAKWKKDAVIFEEGAYIDLAFFIIKGNVEVYLSETQEDAFLSQPIFDPHRTKKLEGSTTAQASQATSGGNESILQTQIKKQPKSDSDIVYLSVMDFNLQLGSSMTLGPGEFFGEIGALSGWPQSVTVRTATDCELIQIKVASLRKMKKKSKDLKAWLDKIYREKYLVSHLKQTPLFQKCDQNFIESLAPKVELVSCDSDETITKEGEKADAIYLVRSGFMKLSQQVGDGQMILSYLSKGMTLGEVEMLMDGMDDWVYTASSVAHAELVKIPFDDMRQIIKTYPAVEKMLWESVVSRVKESGYSRKNINQSEFIETALTHGLVQGNSMLVIDLNVCTRCDDCVRGCAETHGGRPRFVREGDKYQNLLITKACYHCRDPVCLIGCPTGAIHRANVGDVVAINDNICIGCKTCAMNCPYDAIQMHDTGEVWPDNMMPARLRGKNRLLASKCDLCYTSDTGPACVRNCPNGCAVRIGSLEEFQSLLQTDR
ncbi:cyclic nucleotide-binding domain-containing protein [candidate division KSB1 bacterium]|nr:cyclic nucleotide-binding domain-containing protein [candidate division KSB1 bacterium]NIR70745.1 cyclic nucleotide-binding domain-containing protein [candidate division KSB1 bacterium]NIS24603.1 cyclic nucleotide-binding domain-containing protein [candidate division KSB1 bacterium]NIT71512.1 cyclic nucleotide-binding domain-containing protein [candidate division KSB1 bacterium]NIU25203.1 cyclic nucleotide-binding domain-containing protein [candidate division KSB1 bacterium]